MKFLMILISLFVGTGFAADRTDAYNLVCKPMSFDSDKKSCMEMLKKFTYFDDRGLDFCKSLSFASDKIPCLGYIGGKLYEAYEMDHCLKLSFESEKLECLRQSGIPYNTGNTCVQREVAIKQLESGLRDLRARNLEAAEIRLTDLLNHYKDCR